MRNFIMVPKGFLAFCLDNPTRGTSMRFLLWFYERSMHDMSLRPNWMNFTTDEAAAGVKMDATSIERAISFLEHDAKVLTREVVQGRTWYAVNLDR